MTEHTTTSIWLCIRLWTALLIAAVVAFAVYAAPSVHAGDPPGDCWNGALSADPMQCHALEEVQRDGLINVEGIYRGGTSLYVYFTHSDDLTYEKLHEALRTKAKDFAVKHPDRVSFDNLQAHRCDSGDAEAKYRECMIDSTFVDDIIVPWTGDYDRIWLRGGGAESRKAEGGWASWLQLWPDVPTVQVQLDAATDNAGFDITGVDMTNFPEVECTDYNHACDVRSSFPGFDIVGWHDSWITYVEVKALPGQTDYEVAAALKEIAVSRGAEADRMEIIPSKYGYEDYWRWTVILNRFAESPGNTIGIRSAVVGLNIGRYRVATYPVPGLSESVDDSKSDMRTTIELRAYDAHIVAEALPRLLPQLGIPLDAVGLVGQFNETVEVAEPVPGSTIGVDGSGVESTMSGRNSGALLTSYAVAGMIGVVIIGCLSLLMLRRHRSQRAE